MPYTMQDFRRDYVKEHLKDLTFQERLQGLTLEERLRGVPLEEIEKYLRGLKKPSSRKRKTKRNST
jgi:DNA-binding transcriptional MerR regulator